MSGVEKWNDGDCLKWIWAKSEVVKVEFGGVDGRLKFGVRPLYECTNVRMYESTKFPFSFATDGS